MTGQNTALPVFTQPFAAWRISDPTQSTGPSAAVAWVDQSGAPNLAVVFSWDEARPVVEEVPVSTQAQTKELFCTRVPAGATVLAWSDALADLTRFGPQQVAGIAREGAEVLTAEDSAEEAIDVMMSRVFPAADPGSAPPTQTAGVPVELPDGRAYRPRLVGNQVDVDLVRAVRGELFTRIKGRPGNGKTMLAEAAFGEDLIIVEGHGDLTVDDLVGKYLPSESGPGYQWHDGPLTRAMREGKVLLFDEVTRAPSDTVNVLMAPADDRRMLILDGRPDAPEVRAADGFHIIVTYNEFGVGVRPLDEALIRRFPLEIEATTDFDLVADLGVDPRLVAVGRRLADADRNAQERGELGVWTPQTGHLLKADRARCLGLGDRTTAGVLLAACTEPQDLELVAAVIGEELGVVSPQLRQGAAA
ncbi:UNVERIFIED_ORG: dynein-related subfamily AAA family protein [Dietzia maris]|jgi:hypothetical protein|uniref:ATP-binding protein n=1 Tax=Dietzia maris TaxID=37915 RepID=UPI0010EE525F